MSNISQCNDDCLGFMSLGKGKGFCEIMEKEVAPDTECQLEKILEERERCESSREKVSQL